MEIEGNEMNEIEDDMRTFCEAISISSIFILITLLISEMFINILL